MIDRIGVIIVTFKRNKQLSKTLEAVLSQGIFAQNIWVINNDIHDKLEWILDDSRFQHVNLYHSKENIASAGGFAIGMELISKSNCHWAWLFNDDSRPVKGSLGSIIQHQKVLKRSSFGMVKLANINSKGEAILQFWNGSRKPKYVSLSDQLVKTDLVTFDGCLISVSMIKKIGTCDPAYFMGTYEFDYCLKAKDHHFEIYTIPNGMIEDEKAGSVGGTPPWRQYYNTRNHLHLGIQRRDPKIIWAWMIREAKFTYSILRFQDQKTKRLKFKIFAMMHAIIGLRGKFIMPNAI